MDKIIEKPEIFFNKTEIRKFCLQPDNNICISNHTEDFDREICSQCIYFKKPTEK